MGGEKGIQQLYGSHGQGSPPHGRGKAEHEINGLSIYGITPAWAGKRPQASMRPLRSGDHPRMGGEKLAIARLQDAARGSPPHGRGKARVPDGWVSKDGITPAWAGKSYTLAECAAPCWDHPRMGGEKCAREILRPKSWGSPPRGRGKASEKAFSAASTGITPAWAGKRTTLQAAAH